MSSEKRPEERTHTRAPVACKVRLVVEDKEDFSTKFANNISEGGIFVASSGELPVGTKVAVEISLKTGAQLVRAVGEVVRVQKPDISSGKKIGGLAIRFVDLDEASRTVIKEMVAKNKESAAIDIKNTGREHDARTFSRANTARKIRFVADRLDDVLDAVARNVSEGGMFAQTKKPPEIGSLLEVEFALKGGERILSALAKVVWVRSSEEAKEKGEPPGCGLEFKKLSPGVRDEIKDLVSKFEASKEDASPSADSAEKRRFARIPLKRKIKIIAESYEEALEAMSKNISEGGLFIVSEKLPEMGTKLEVEFSLQDGERILTARSEVVWLKKKEDIASPDESTGFGLKFIELTPGDREEIKALVEKFNTGGGQEPAQGETSSEHTPAGKAGPATAGGEKTVAREAEPAEQEGESARVEPAVDTGPKGKESDFAGDVRKEEETGSTTEPEPVPVEGQGGIKAVGIDLSGDLYRVSVLLGQSVRVLKPAPASDDIPGIERLLGRRYKARSAQEISRALAVEIAPDARREAAIVTTDGEVPVEELVARRLTRNVTLIRSKLKVQPSGSYVAVPGHFDSQQRQAVKSAAKRSGLGQAKLVSRTAAAAIAYSFNQSREELIFVYDLGSTGFEAAIVQVTGNAVQVMARVADPSIGGAELVKPVYDLLRQALAEASGGSLPDPLEQVMEMSLKREACRAAAELLECGTVEIEQPRFGRIKGKDVDLNVSIDNDILVSNNKGLIDRTMQLSRDMLTKYGVDASKLDTLLSIGKFSRMDFVKNALKESFGLEPARELDPERAPAIGAGLLADAENRVDIITLRDVCSHTIGIGLPGGGFEPLFPRNTILPSTSRRLIGSAKPDRTIMEVHLFHGGAYDGAYSEYLSSYILPVAHGKDGPMYELSVGVDEEEILRVEAKDLETNENISLGPAAPADPDEVATKLGVMLSN
ncbi:MAG: Hsp70 family protein [Deltaproteobacteria bacterium]|nr:Hsp70 family protein [Deltaproteobacteria bacterium]